VLSGGLPTARRTDKALCPGGPDVISLGSFSVLIGGQPAARRGDATAHGGVVAAGLASVLVGDNTATGGSSRTFATQEEAARAALNEANPQSITTNLEVGGLVYRDANGRYGYTAPLQGTVDGFNPGAVTVPPGTTVVGDYHTHADYSVPNATGGGTRTSDPGNDGYGSDGFSQPDRTGIAADAAGNADYRGYLGTPGGTFHEYNPATNTTRTIPGSPSC